MAKKPWIKLWPDKLLASPRWKYIDMYQAGTYLQILLRVNSDGELKTSGLVWKVKDLAFDIGLDTRRTKRLQKAVDKLVRLDLCRIGEDGAICVSRFQELQERSKASQAGDVRAMARRMGKTTK